jgi:hypothetical protein
MAAFMARCVAGPSTSSLSSLPAMKAFAGGAGLGSSAAGAGAHAESAAAAASAPIRRI